MDFVNSLTLYGKVHIQCKKNMNLQNNNGKTLVIL